jgi:hypothetical protein
MANTTQVGGAATARKYVINRLVYILKYVRKRHKFCFLFMLYIFVCGVHLNLPYLKNAQQFLAILRIFSLAERCIVMLIDGQLRILMVIELMTRPGLQVEQTVNRTQYYSIIPKICEICSKHDVRYSKRLDANISLQKLLTYLMFG